MSRGIDEQGADALVQRLQVGRDELVEAAVLDGWPRPMAKAGFRRHFETWNAERIAASIRREFQAVDEAGTYRIVSPGRVHHIWPALPGAGVAPFLVGRLLGADQKIRPSRRGIHFGRQFAEIAATELIEPGGRWNDADLVVVSGSDETVLEVRSQMAGRGRVVGYDDRVSMAVVVDDDDRDFDLSDIASGIADDVAMWHGRGCFSVRAVLFCGTDERRRLFCGELAAEIAERENRWGTAGIADEELADRAQQMGLAEMRGDVFCEGIGYVRIDDEPFDGGREAVHSVTVHPAESPAQLSKLVDVEPTGMQGVALADSTNDGAWREVIAQLGATRICEPGRLQTPPPEWWHDGRPNALSFCRVVTTE